MPLPGIYPSSSVRNKVISKISPLEIWLRSTLDVVAVVWILGFWPPLYADKLYLTAHEVFSHCFPISICLYITYRNWKFRDSIHLLWRWLKSSKIQTRRFVAPRGTATKLRYWGIFRLNITVLILTHLFSNAFLQLVSIAQTSTMLRLSLEIVKQLNLGSKLGAAKPML
jgi:hypothetical protein